ncbi:hypothetical protein HNV10_12365 [Winogradskyella litoriviva]|uniref:Erythromycin esterase family protein n=1 Tax=Winogradskyella litoriviva TaxID=1220182 RepID=A0ABX2E6M8_9FLAO|nr:hypothetical protein [Winogradskyella litoriviva]NRD24045.1 hypothetical protein [Winogradskyella litoriviva]
MCKFIILLFSILILQSCKETKISYLEQNRFDLTSQDFDFPEKDFNILGFGAYHGSAKTEDVEIKLLHALTKNGTIKYYLPEVDYSTAYYYNEFLETGDTALLKELIIYNGYHITQERTIEVYDKWKQIKHLNDRLPENKKLKILGIEWIRNYKYVTKHIVELIKDQNNQLQPIRRLKQTIAADTTNYSIDKPSLVKQNLKDLITDYENDKKRYTSKIENVEVFEMILKNIKHSFEEQPEREQIIYHNYLTLKSEYNFSNNPQFMRVGFFHLEKSREGKDGYPSLFARLVENKIYPKQKIISVIGYFTDSKVFWSEQYDKNGDYSGYSIEAGFGIGDYEKEYFRGIQNLKNTKLSDKTLFRLNQSDSPYFTNEPDLIEIIMQDEASNSEAVKGMSTLDFLDYAILISDSKASVPIYEMK